MKLKNVKGMRDLTGNEIRQFQKIESKAREILSVYGYKELRTPILERTDLFTHGVGADTDIVGKEMYLLEDRRGESLAMRPEGTAPVVRHVIQNNLLKSQKNARFFYTGPMFRFERPQKGRFRQFHQLGVEIFGIDTPDADLELFLMLRQYFKEINLHNVSFQLNTIGCQNEACRPAFKQKLIDYLSEHKESLCEDCQRRMGTNPLRVLDCKVPGCIEVTKGAPVIYEEVCSDCSDHFAELKDLLDLHEIVYELNPKLVRGLDYYSRTVFEIYSSDLGAQSAAGGGGRYDALFESYGAEASPAIGFALGVDRLAMLMKEPDEESIDIFVVGHDRAKISEVVATCRQQHWSTMYDPGMASFKSQMRQANKENARLVLILGEEEMKNGQISIKNMQEGGQETVALENFEQTVLTRIKTD